MTQDCHYHRDGCPDCEAAKNEPRCAQVAVRPIGDRIDLRRSTLPRTAGWLYCPRTGEVVEILEWLDEAVRVRRRAHVVVSRGIYATDTSGEPYRIDSKVAPYDEKFGPMEMLELDWLVEVPAP